jgi:hypothetical protein
MSVEHGFSLWDKKADGGCLQHIAGQEAWAADTF